MDNNRILEELVDIKKILNETIIKKQLNALIALLIVNLGKKGQEELIKKRRATKEIVAYLENLIGLPGKDLAGILNTSKSGISNLKKRSKKQRNKK